MIIFPVKIIDCLILGCNSFIMVSGEELIKFISETNNEKLIKKYKPSIILYEYYKKFFFPGLYCKLIDLLFDFYKSIAKLFEC